MDELLIGFGLNITSNVVYDVAKKVFNKYNNPSKDQLVKEIEPLLNIQNAHICAEKIIDFMAKNGDIIIEGTYVYATNKITMVSNLRTSFIFGNNSESRTKDTSIIAGQGAFIHGQGGARIIQGEDGSISFYT